MSDGASSGAADRRPQKKRRVTKACDQCRKRRVKCQAYSDSELDAPCVVCTENGAASSCTYSRPSRKRGPMAGHAKNLAERLNGLERLMGHLLIVHPPILALTSPFFDFQASRSSASASAQMTAFHSSPLPALLEALATPDDSSLAQENDELKRDAALDNTQFTLEGGSAEELLSSLIDPSEHMGWSPQSNFSERSPMPTVASIAGPNSSNLRNFQRSGAAPDFQSLMSFSNLRRPASSSVERKALPEEHIQHSARDLHTLATAAATNFDPTDSDAVTTSNLIGMEVVEDEENIHKLVSKDFGGVSELPAEELRNQLVDLYFNQIVHPTYPMLEKARFMRWSSNASQSSTDESCIPPELYFAVFASVVPYLSPSSARKTLSAKAFADISRAHLSRAINNPGVETVQACCLLALSDWGQGEFSRAWVLSCLAIVLGINLSLHIATKSPAEISDSISIKTFHSALIIHTMISLRLERPPIVVPTDYDLPLPSSDGPDNFDIWRSDKSPAQLRAEYGSTAAFDNSDGLARTPTMRSSTLAVFSKTASLCAIGIQVIRFCLHPPTAHRLLETERLRLINLLQSWEDELPHALRVGESAREGKVLSGKPRHILDMHFLLLTLYFRLSPSKETSAHATTGDRDPVPTALGVFTDLLAEYSLDFTFYRSLPSIELSLHSFAECLTLRNGPTANQYQALLMALAELKEVLPLGETSFAWVKTKLDACKYETKKEGLYNMSMPIEDHLRSHSMDSKTSQGAQDRLSLSSYSLIDAGTGRTEEFTPARLEHSHEPFQAFLNFSTGLGPTAPTNTVLDYAQWDQTDLLVSLGLVLDPSNAQPWQPPAQGSNMSGMMAPLESQSLPSNTQSTEMLSRWLDRGMIDFQMAGGGLN